MNRLILVSGCSGGGKSSLVAALAKRGFSTIEEPGRRIVGEELERAGNALPWINMAAFADRAIAMAMEDFERARKTSRLAFFDRGLIDAVAALQHATGKTIPARLIAAHRQHAQVFLTPPWPEIFVADRERRHDLTAAIAEYDRLASIFPALGYEVQIVPKMAIEQRVDFILSYLPQTFFA